MQHMTLEQVQLIPWYVCGMYFAASYLNVKRTKMDESISSRVVRYAPMVFAGLLLADRRFSVGILGQRFIRDAFWIHVLGILVSSIGMAFTIWARSSLSDNWSPNITLKEQHQLIRSGPYALVRHPIYTGFSFALIGAVLQVGEYRAILAFYPASRAHYEGKTGRKADEFAIRGEICRIH